VGQAGNHLKYITVFFAFPGRLLFHPNSLGRKEISVKGFILVIYISPAIFV